MKPCRKFARVRFRAIGALAALTLLPAVAAAGSPEIDRGRYLAIIGGCTAETKAKNDKLCTPEAYVFCRCQDRQEGAKLCNETGDGFGCVAAGQVQRQPLRA